MKKIFLTLAMISGSALAMTTMNLSTDKVVCHNQVLNKQLSESMIMANCKSAKKMTKDDVVASHSADKVRGGDSDDIQDDDIQDINAQYDILQFMDDQSRTIKCYFKNSKLTQCKIKVKPAKASAGAAVTK